MSKGVTASGSGFAPRRHVSRVRLLRGLGERYRREKFAEGARKDCEREQTRVAAREKEKAPGPCELRALLRDEPSRPCTRHGLKAHHRAPPDLAIRRRQLCSGARPSAQPYVACRDEIGIASDRFKAGNDRNASPGELDFMHGGMTSRHMKAL